MTYPHVVTRIATADDLLALDALWDELRQVGGRAERAVNPVTAQDVSGRLVDVMNDPMCRVVIAEVAGVPAGMTVLQVLQPDPLSDSKVMKIAHLVVSRAHRNHGIGYALIAAASDFAVERHIDHVVASVYPSLREANRFFARLGFAPVAVRRIAPVAVLRRRLGSEHGLPALADVVRRRTRIARPMPAQRSRRVAPERIDN